MEQLFHQPGFLGTQANLAADVTLVIMLVTAGLFSLGAVLARREQFEAHRWVQTGAAALNLIFVLWMMILPFRDFVIRDQGGPRPLYFYGVTIAHAAFGVVATVFGLFVVLRGNGLVPRTLRFQNYKPYMQLAYGLYMLATLLGVNVYLTWFVWVPNPPQF